MDNIRTVSGKQWMRMSEDRERWKQLGKMVGKEELLILSSVEFMNSA